MSLFEFFLSFLPVLKTFYQQLFTKWFSSRFFNFVLGELFFFEAAVDSVIIMSEADVDEGFETDGEEVSKVPTKKELKVSCVVVIKISNSFL